MQQQAAYYQNLPPSKRDNMDDEEKRNNYLMENLLNMKKQFDEMQKLRVKYREQLQMIQPGRIVLNNKII